VSVWLIASASSEHPVRFGSAARDVEAIAEVLVRVARARSELMLQRQLVLRVGAARHRPHLRAVVARAVEEVGARDHAADGAREK